MNNNFYVSIYLSTENLTRFVTTPSSEEWRIQRSLLEKQTPKIKLSKNSQEIASSKIQ